MKQNNKSIILAVLTIAAVSIWIPKGAKPVAASADTSEADTFEQERPVMAATPGKRTEFVEWGRDPFIFSQQEEQEETGDISNLLLRAILWKTEEPSAFINDSIVVVGDKIADKTVKKIEKNRVILSEGVNDYILEISE